MRSILLTVIGLGCIAFAAPDVFAAPGTACSGGRANGARVGTHEYSYNALACPTGCTQTPTSGPSVCTDSGGSYSTCTSDGACAPITCCQLIMRHQGPQGQGAGYPHPDTKGDCPSCPLPGVCQIAVTPATGNGPIEAQAACD